MEIFRQDTIIGLSQGDRVLGPHPHFPTQDVLGLLYRNHINAIQKILIETKSIITAVTFCSPLSEIQSILRRHPICPPRKTARIKGMKSSIPIRSPSLAQCPQRPAKELTKMKKLDEAAICRALPQPKKKRRGDRKIPPPIPTSPETNPKRAPTKSPIPQIDFQPIS